MGDYTDRTNTWPNTDAVLPATGSAQDKTPTPTPTPTTDREVIAQAIADSFEQPAAGLHAAPGEGDHAAADAILALGFHRSAAPGEPSAEPTSEAAYRDALRHFLATYQDGRGIRMGVGTFAFNAATAAFKAAWVAAHPGARAAQTAESQGAAATIRRLTVERDHHMRCNDPYNCVDDSGPPGTWKGCVGHIEAALAAQTPSEDVPR